MKTTIKLLLLLAAVVLPQGAAGDVIELGNGTEMSEVQPIHNWWLSSYQGNEQLYFKDELGLQKGDQITAISYPCVEGSAKGGNFNVRIKNTSLTQLYNGTLNQFEDPSVLKVSYDDKVYGNVQLAPYSAGDWVTFPLSEPFVYEGENIIIDIRNTKPGSSSGWCYCSGTMTSHLRRNLCWRNADDERVSGFHYGESPTGPNDSGFYINDENQTEDYRPDIRITYTPAAEPASVSAPSISVSRTDVGRVMQLPITLQMPEGGDFTNIQIEVTFPEGLHPIMDADGCYGYGGNDIPKKGKSPVVAFSDNLNMDSKWPTYMILGTNVTLTPVTTNPCHVYTINVTATPDFEPGEREITVYVKYTDSSNKSHAIGSEDSHVTLSTVNFVDSDLLLGDANLDGRIDVEDLNIAINIILGINTLKLNQIYAPRVDINQNGNVDIADMNAIINTMLGLGTNWHDDIITYNVNGVEFKMVKVEGGTFTMGDDESMSYNEPNPILNDLNTPDWKPAHNVTLSSYYIGQTEVTQELWQAVMGSNPSYFTGNLQRPVENVNWESCQTFISKLNELTGETFRLPTEAEWEYAARGGSKSKSYNYSGSNNLSEIAWCDYNSDGITHPVGTKIANELGLYDMSGNVWEYCQDWAGDYSSESQTNPMGPSSGTLRIQRGGCYNNITYCNVAFRLAFPPTRGHSGEGLRLAK